MPSAAHGCVDLRLLEITEVYVNPPPVSEEAPVETEEEIQEFEATTEAESAPEIPSDVQQPTIGGLPSTSGSINFSFMQESELEQDPVAFENGAEWVEREDVLHAPEQPVPVEVVEIRQEATSIEIAQVRTESSRCLWQTSSV